MTIKINNIHCALNLLKQSKISVINSNCKLSPFFESIPDTTYNINYPIDIAIDKINKSTSIINHNKTINLPTKLLYMYCLLDSSNREINYNNFIFMSFNEIIDRYNLYKKNGQNKLCDLAIKYDGMGYIFVLTYNIYNGTFFFRRDGGSNDWERQTNWDFIKNYEPEYNKSYDLDKILTIILNNNNIYNIIVN